MDPFRSAELDGSSGTPPGDRYGGSPTRSQLVAILSERGDMTLFDLAREWADRWGPGESGDLSTARYRDLYLDLHALVTRLSRSTRAVRYEESTGRVSLTGADWPGVPRAAREGDVGESAKRWE
ncbi:MAG: hypothetical protein ABEJ61_01330 [Haloferacaceae archaeon]